MTGGFIAPSCQISGIWADERRYACNKRDSKWQSLVGTLCPRQGLVYLWKLTFSGDGVWETTFSQKWFVSYLMPIGCMLVGGDEDTPSQFAS